MKSKMTPKINTALLVIDVQKELFEKSTPIYKADDLLENICSLIDQAHNIGAPVFFIQHSSDKILLRGTDGWELHSKLHPQAIDHIVEKQHGNAFEKTNLKDKLDSLNIGQLVITGLVTHGCVKATSLGARELGYSVILVKDGHSNFHQKAPEIILEWNEKLSLQGVNLLTTQEVVF
jgi:nicotinamidase-related amidase